MTDNTLERKAARRARHRQAARVAYRAAWTRLARSTVRDLLLEGPAGGDPFGEAIVALLDTGDLLSHDGFVVHCVEVHDEDPVTWADLDQDRLRAGAGAGLPIELDPVQQRLLQLAVTLLDLAGHLHDRDCPVTAQAARSALRAVLARPRPGKAGACCSFWDGPHDVELHVPDVKANANLPEPGRAQSQGDLSALPWPAVDAR